MQFFIDTWQIWVVAAGVIGINIYLTFFKKDDK